MNMLNKKITHSRLRDKPDQKNIKKETKTEDYIQDNKLRKKVSNKNKSKEIKIPKYLSYLHEILQPGCFECRTKIGIHMHHIKHASSDPKDDRLVIPLCYNHHLGSKFSIHGTPVAFREKYSYDVQSYAAQKLYTAFKG